MTNGITIEKQGRRHYVRNAPYAMKDALRNAGCKWDPEQKCWWTSKADVAEQFAGAVAPAGATGATGSTGGTGSSGGTGSGREAPGTDATVAARATYKGKTYYVAGRVNRGRTHWDDTVSQVQTRDGGKTLLYFRDGSSSFWAARQEVQIVKIYSKPTTIARLQEYAAEAKSAGVGKLEDGYYVLAGEVLASGCSECRRLGRMCRSCQHDYE